MHCMFKSLNKTFTSVIVKAKRPQELNYLLPSTNKDESMKQKEIKKPNLAETEAR